MWFRRRALAETGVLPSPPYRGAQGTRLTIAGLCLRPHRPPTPSGETFVFLLLEDETGRVQVTITPDAYKIFGPVLFTSAILAVEGVAEKRGAGVALRAVDARVV